MVAGDPQGTAEFPPVRRPSFLARRPPRIEVDDQIPPLDYVGVAGERWAAGSVPVGDRVPAAVEEFRADRVRDEVDARRLPGQGHRVPGEFGRVVEPAGTAAAT